MKLQRAVHAVFTIMLVAGAVLPRTALAGAMEVLYEQKCGRCHVAHAPEEYPAEDWRNLVLSMKAQAALSADEIEQITDYLSSTGGEGSEDDGFRSEGPSVGGYLYTEYFESKERAKNFDIHYLAVVLSGWAAENISYFGEFELEHGGKGDNTFVEQAYIDYWFLPNVALRTGAMLTPFNRFDEFHEPLSNFTITRPQVSRAIGVSAWKEVGADLHGYLNVRDGASIGFDLYTINGLGDGANLRGSRQYRDNNEDKAFGGRVNLMVRDMVEIGGSAYRGAWDDGGELDLTLFGGHLMVRTPVADFYGEYTDATSENPGALDDGEMSGFFVQASRLFRSRFRPTVRYGALDYLDPGDELGRDPAKGDADLSEFVLAFAYYPVPRVVFKTEYQIFEAGDRAGDVDSYQFGLQAAVRF